MSTETTQDIRVGRTLMDCIASFARDFPTFEERVPLSYLSGIAVDTTSMYCRGKSKPVGLYWAKVAYAVHFMGYRVGVLDDVRPGVYNLGKLLAIDALSVEDAEKLLDTKVSEVYRYIMAKTTPGDARQAMIDMIVEERMGQIDAWNEKYSKYKSIRPYKPDRGSIPSPNKHATKPEARLLEAISEAKHERSFVQGVSEIQILANLILAALPLAELIVSDDFSPEDRAELRRLCGKYGVFNLKNALTGLCGERARTEL